MPMSTGQKLAIVGALAFVGFIIMLGIGIAIYEYSQPAASTSPNANTNTTAAPTFTVYTNMDAISGMLPGVPPSVAPGITYYGTTTDAPTCQTACANNASCAEYVWTDSTGGSFANTCYLLDNTVKPANVAQTSSTSGVKIPAERFSPQKWARSYILKK